MSKHQEISRGYRHLCKGFQQKNAVLQRPPGQWLFLPADRCAMMYHSKRDWRREEQKLSLQSTHFGTGASGNMQRWSGISLFPWLLKKESGMAGWPRHATVAKEWDPNSSRWVPPMALRFMTSHLSHAHHIQPTIMPSSLNFWSRSRAWFHGHLQCGSVITSHKTSGSTMCRSKISLNLRCLAVIARATCCMYQAPGRLGIGGSYIFFFKSASRKKNWFDHVPQTEIPLHACHSTPCGESLIAHQRWAQCLQANGKPIGNDSGKSEKGLKTLWSCKYLFVSGGHPPNGHWKKMVVKCSDIPLETLGHWGKVYWGFPVDFQCPQLHLRSRQRTGPCLSLEQPSGLWGQEFTWKIHPQRQTTPSLIVLSVLHKECVEHLTGKKSVVQCVFSKKSMTLGNFGPGRSDFLDSVILNRISRLD